MSEKTVRLYFNNDEEGGSALPISVTYVRQIYDLLKVGPNGDVIAQLNEAGRWELTEHAELLMPTEKNPKGKTFESFTVVAD